MSKDKISAHAMAFYHEKGLPSAWRQADKFAGKGGRLATMPDIVAARIMTKPGEVPWETYFTSLSAEYLGHTRKGTKVLIVAHGTGPMSTLDGVQKAYSWEYKDPKRIRNGGRISEQEFWDLEAGKFGKVDIIDFDSYCRRYGYPFIQFLRLSEAMSDPVLKARLGPEAETFLTTHASIARAWHCEEEKRKDQYRRHHNEMAMVGSDPYLIQVGDPGNCNYIYHPIEAGNAFGHLISTGRFVHTCHERLKSLTIDVGCFEWWNGVRLVGIRPGEKVVTGIHEGPDVHHLLQKHWRELLVPMDTPEILGFRALRKIGDQWFTQYPKMGESMDTHEPEYVVTSIEEIGKPLMFRTTIGGYHGFFKFGVSEVRGMAPPHANAYSFVSEPENEWIDGAPTHQTALVQFYKIKADTSKRMIRADELCHDYETIMSLVEKDSALQTARAV